MSEHIWQGRCRDCYNKNANLQPLNDKRLMQPAVLGMVLCPTCMKARQDDFVNGETIRPIGIPQDIPIGRNGWT